MKIRAAVLRAMGSERPYAQSQPLQVEELELDPPGEGEVLVRIRAAGLCHSDLSVVDGKRPRPLPIVIGLGGVGLAALLGARRLEARTLVAVDFSDEKLAMARELGATHTVNARDDKSLDAIREATGGGAQYVFEMAGSVPALEMAYRVTRRGGTTVTAGLPDLQARISIQPSRLVTEERCIRGSFMGSCVPERDIPRFIDWFRAGALPVDRLLAERIALDAINAGFDRLADGRSARQLVIP